MTQVKKKVLIIGVGSIGLRHLRCFHQTGRADLAFCEIQPALRDQVAREYGFARSYADLEAALNAEHPDAAIIATPAHLHVPQAVRLAEAGVHLLIEKPLSTTLDRIDELRQLVREKNLVAAVAYVYRAIPVLAAMRTAIVEGRFGPPLQIIVVAGQHFPTYRPAYREIYYRDRATGGGAIQDALTHLFNAGEWLVGPIERLVVDAAHLALEGVEVEDTVHAITRHGGVLGFYSLNQHQAPNEITITVVCRQGTARFEGHLTRWRWMTKPEEPWCEEHMPYDRDELFIRQANAFLDAIEGFAPPLCSLEEGLQTLRVNLAALRSTEQKTWVQVM